LWTYKEVVMQGSQDVVGLYDQNVAIAQNLKLELLNPHNTHSDQKSDMVFDEQGGVIGRGSDCDWILRCTRRLISRRHAIISFMDGQYYIQDASSNGIVLNDSTDAIPQGMCTPLQEGDIFFIGDLSISVSLMSSDSLDQADEQLDQQGYAPEMSDDMDTPIYISKQPVRDSFSELPQQRLKQVAEENHDQIARRAAELGRPDDHFEPPKALIPDNWDLDISAHSRTPSDVVDKPAKPRFSEKRSILDALFTGMGLSGKAVEQSLNPESMEILGRCLRINIEGLARLRTGHSKIESALLQEKMIQHDNASGIKISTVEPFINICMSSEQHKAESLVAQLKMDYTDLIGQQAAIIDCLGKVGGIVAEQFDPERIENAFNRFQAQQAKKRPWYLAFRKLDIKATYTEFFQVYYKLRRRETDRALKCVFGQRFLAFYSGRLRGK